MKDDPKLGVCFISTYFDDYLNIGIQNMLVWVLEEIPKQGQSFTVDWNLTDY